MAYINVAEWTIQEVTDWLKGLDDSMYNYIYSFTNNEVRGQQLLNIRPYELEQLGIYSVGHQEIVLEAVEHLRNFHYNLDKENLQFLAMHVASAARSLFRQLSHHKDKSKLETPILNDITRTIATIKHVINWLDRPPFQGQLQFIELRKNMLRLGSEMATTAQRDRFVENPVEQVRLITEKLAKLADYIIQDITDPMVLQPGSLKLVTLKKRESELGFSISQSYHGVHRVTDIKYNSPAHTAGKIEDGDEIVQINYQTVVGWQNKTVILQLRESPPDILLTLKKRPKHTKIYGQIYMQPYRLPSKKRSITSRWADNLPSPRSGFLAVSTKFLKVSVQENDTKETVPGNSSDTDSICSDILTPTEDTKSVDKDIRMYYPKPRAVLQRRNTICGDEFQYLKNHGNLPIWHERRRQNVVQDADPSSPSLRDKSVSFGYGLEISSRTTTCLGISNNKFSEFLNANNTSMPDIGNGKSIERKNTEIYSGIKNCMKNESKPGVCKVVRFDAGMKNDDYSMDNKNICFVENTILETFEPIPYADEEDEHMAKEELVPDVDLNAISLCYLEDMKALDDSKLEYENSTKDAAGLPIRQENICQAVNVVAVQRHQRRGRLDKSHSTPAYDNSEDDVNTEQQPPPNVEPRKEALGAPVPPPRPRKQSMDPSMVPVPPPKPQKYIQLQQHQNNQKNQSDQLFEKGRNDISANTINEFSETENNSNQLELLTPVKSKTLTLKKKNSLMAKRRKITLKSFGQVSEIQGHLYRRTKDKRGVTFWAKLYFVLIDTVLYGFRTKDAPKANCMVILPGFTVSLAKEVHSKPFAFKVYHAIKTFYFAAESAEALNQWMEIIRMATTKEQNDNQEIISKDLFSETDSSGDESDIQSKVIASPTISAKESGGKSASENTTAIKSDNKYLGSLKKLTKSSLQFKANNSNVSEKKSSDIPVPTAQFRSFRKIPGGSFGLQIGTNSGYSHFESSCSIMNSPQPITPSKNETTFFPPERAKIMKPPSIIEDKEESEDNYKLSKLSIDNQQSNSMLSSIDGSIHKKINKHNSPHNFIHASNPNLVEFDFPTSKTLDHSMPKINTASSAWDTTPNSLQGFVTLKDLMLQKQEEESKEMYNNRVVVGVEKQDNCKEHFRNTHVRDNSISSMTSSTSTIVSSKLSKNQNRSLPKTPDYEISFKPDDEDIRMTRTKEGQKLRDFGYEFIYGDDPTSDEKKAINTNKDLQKYHMILNTGGYHNKKKYSVSSIVSIATGENVMINKSSSTRGSLKKAKGKFDAFKTSSEKLFQFKNNSNDDKTKSTIHSPNTLPKKSGQQHEVVSLRKSQTYNNEFKDRKIFEQQEVHRKNSAPTMPILSKFSIPYNKSAKEKKLLGSPRLHRAVFGRGSHRLDHNYDHEIFCPITFSKKGSDTSSISSTMTISSEKNGDKILTTQQNIQHTQPTPITYPNMIVPPVFQPETYSLSDPKASLTLIRRRSANISKDEKDES